MKLISRLSYGILALLILVAVQELGFVAAEPAPQEALSSTEGRDSEDLQAVTIVFGIRDPTATVWDGTATISNGAIEKITGYHFTEDSEILPNHSWKCSTHPWPAITFDLGAEDKMTPYPRWVQ